jgi:hypothetical protein
VSNNVVFHSYRIQTIVFAILGIRIEDAQPIGDPPSKTTNLSAPLMAFCLHDLHSKSG